MEDLKEIIACNNKLSNNTPYGVVAIVGEFSTMTPEAKELSAKGIHSKNRKALAVVITNMGHQLVINFYMSFYKPENPTRAFKNHEDAVKWLRKTLEELL